ncbi:MAG: response regulator [Pseudomonadota bacterium]
MITIAVIDDQRLVRHAISSRLKAVDDFSVIAEGESGEVAREIAAEQHPQVMLMDLNMPGIGGIEATRRIAAAHAQVRIIGLSMYVKGPYPKWFLQAGGAGYVSKNAHTEELVKAIRIVESGELYISPDVANFLALNDSQRIVRNGIDDLSPREVQVMRLICEGLNMDDIGGRLSLSAKTVAHHRRQLLAKLRVDNDVQLARLAIDQGLVDMEATTGN